MELDTPDSDSDVWEGILLGLVIAILLWAAIVTLVVML